MLRTKIVALATSLITLGAAAGFSAGTTEAGSATGSAPDIESNFGKNTWELADWERASGQQLTLSEAPELAAMVRSGDLPPLEQRLPNKPVVYLPLADVKKIGSYEAGPVWIQSDNVGNNNDGMGRREEAIGGEFARHWESWTASNGGRTWTIKIREGIKWSDGVEYTTEDVQFYWDDFYKFPGAETLSYVTGNRGVLGDSTLRVIDRYTYSLTFPEPNIGLLGRLGESVFGSFPKAYLSQFHPKYIGEAAAKRMATAAGYGSIADFVDAKVDYRQGFPPANTDLPTLGEWSLTQGAPANTYIFERNPYFYGVDAIGQQLPYISEVRREATTDENIRKLRALNGEYDYVAFNGLDIFPAAKEAERNEGNIIAYTHGHVFMTGGGAMLEFNQTVDNDDLRELFAKRDFRCGISLAINRAANQTLLYYGRVSAGQLSYPPGNPYYSESLASTCVPYDLDQANTLLDRAGLRQRDGDGNRLWKGSPLEFTLTTRIQHGLDKDADLVASSIADTGIKVNIRSTDGWGGLQAVRNSGEMEAYFGSAWSTYANGPLETASLGGMYGNHGFFAPRWAEWVASEGSEGERPHPDVIKAVELRQLIATQPSLADRQATMKQITDLAAKNLWAIGVTGTVRTQIQDATMANLPGEAPNTCWHCGGGPRMNVWFHND
jgi:peptide/nickel transport system substrate-binding protein